MNKKIINDTINTINNNIKDKNVKLIICNNNNNFDDCKNILKDAFMSYKLFDWCLKTNDEKIKNLNDDELIELKTNLVYFISDLSTELVISSNGICVLLKDINTDETLGAAIISYRKKPSFFTKIMFQMLSMYVLAFKVNKIPEFLKSTKKYGSSVKDKLTICGEIETYHNQYVKENHLYLLQVGVNPKHQGKKFGSIILDFVSLISDNLKLDCYLETDEYYLEKFYKKYNFETIGNYELKYKNDDIFEPNFGMYRKYKE